MLMMGYKGIELLLLFLATWMICSDGRQQADLRESRGGARQKEKVLLHHAVRALLRFDRSPQHAASRSGTTGQATESLMEAAPKYMLDLYQKYKHGTITKGDYTGNTVRSIHADIGVVNGQHMFLFNLSAITPAEKVFSAEIHIYKKKIKTRVKKSEIRLILYEIAPSYLSEIGTFRMHAESHGWQWYDVIRAVNSCLSAHRRAPHLFGMKFEAVKPNGHLSAVSIRKFMRHLSKPFLIVFSNDTQNITLDHVEPYFNPEDLKKDLNVGDFSNVKPKTRKRLTLNQGGDSSRSKSDDKDESDGTPLTENSSNKGAAKPSGLVERKRRSIYDNEIPEHTEDMFGPVNKYHMPKTHPGILQSRSQSARQKITQSKLIPYPDQYKRQRKRRKHRKNKKNRRRFENKRIPLPREWESENSAAVKEKDRLCGRKKLVVDFADIGWAEWIISPKSFEAHYCSGMCPFPLSKGLRPSNHATIQSIVHAIGIQNEVPAPCCVPDSLSSVTLLYFDEHRNVVLKNYPGMTVQSCACR